MFVVVLITSVLWVSGIDYMMKNHPDYKGEDLFGDGFNFDDKEEEAKCHCGPTTCCDCVSEETQDNSIETSGEFDYIDEEHLEE